MIWLEENVIVLRMLLITQVLCDSKMPFLGFSAHSREKA